MIGNERSAEARGGTVNMRLTIFWIWNLFGESIEGLPLEGPSFELHVYMDLPPPSRALLKGHVYI